jgi:DnaK suppressor protein
MVLKEGRFGPYVTDGETNASLRAGDTVEEITPERASELLQIRREAGPSKKKKAPAKKAAAKKVTPAAVATTPASKPSVRVDEEPWSDAELTEVRGTLAAERDRLSQELDGLQTAITDVMRDTSDGAGEDQADTGSKALEREQELTLLSNVRETLQQTEHALERLDMGTYGNCESCGQPIGKARLQAFPRATLCVTCKQREERR